MYSHRTLFNNYGIVGRLPISCFLLFASLPYMSICLAVIHQPHPRHLIAGLQFFGGSCRFCHLRHYPVQPVICGVVDVQQMCLELTSGHQLLVQLVPVLL